MIVILDASVGIEVALDRPRAQGYSEVLAKAEKVLSSDLYKVEVANVLWKYVRAGLLPAGEAGNKLRLALNLVDQFIDSQQNNEEALQESIRINHAVYDLMYFTLARRTGGTLATLDKKLSDLCHSHGITSI